MENIYIYIYIPGKRVYERRVNPNPLTPKEDDQMDRRLKYYIYRSRDDMALQVNEVNHIWVEC
jgi:hypothetical protein